MAINNQYAQMQYQILSPMDPGTIFVVVRIYGGISPEHSIFPFESYFVSDNAVVVFGVCVI